MAEVTTADGFSVSSNTETEAQLRAALVEEPVAPPSEPLVTPPPPESDKPEPPDPSAERNADGTFKAKAEKPRDDPRARVQEATAKEATAKRERDEAKAETARVHAELAALKAPKPAAVTAPADDPEPDPANTTKYAEGQYDRQFIKDQARWEARQEFREQQHVAQAAAQKDYAERTQRARVTQWETKLAAAKVKYPDFDRKVNADLELPWPVIHAIADSDVGPDLLYHYQDDLQRISTLPPGDFFRQLGRLEARWDAAHVAPAPKAPPVSKAPAPIQPVGSSPSVTDTPPDPEDTDLDAHMRYYDRKERAVRR